MAATIGTKDRHGALHMGNGPEPSSESGAGLRLAESLLAKQLKAERKAKRRAAAAVAGKASRSQDQGPESECRPEQQAAAEALSVKQAKEQRKAAKRAAAAAARAAAGDPFARPASVDAAGQELLAGASKQSKAERRAAKQASAVATGKAASEQYRLIPDGQAGQQAPASAVLPKQSKAERRAAKQASAAAKNAGAQQQLDQDSRPRALPLEEPLKAQGKQRSQKHKDKHQAAGLTAAGRVAAKHAHLPERQKVKRHKSASGPAQPPAGAHAAAHGVQAECAGQQAAGYPADGPAAQPAAAGAAAQPSSSRKRKRSGAEADVNTATWREDSQRTNAKRGRFSKAERETLRRAVLDYADAHELSHEDTSWLYATRTGSHKAQASGAWQIIAQALPHRTMQAVYSMGSRMFHEGNYKGAWQPEEDQHLMQLVAERGRRWKEIGLIIGRMGEACRDRHRELALGPAKRRGKWDDAETARLRSLVEDYLELRQSAQDAGEEAVLSLDAVGSAAAAAAAAKSAPRREGRIVLDDVDWVVISEQHGSRAPQQCLEKWYCSLCPSMVARGLWSSGDDKRMLRAMVQTGACEEYHLDWDRLVPGRTGQQARRRWRTMLKEVQDAAEFSFRSQLEALASRYHPRLLEEDQGQPQQT